MRPREHLSLIVDSDPAQVIVARSFVASLLRVEEARQQRIEDARLVVSELVTTFVETRGASSITIEAVVEDDRIAIEVGSDGPVPALSNGRRSLIEQVAIGPVRSTQRGWQVALDAR